MLSSLSGFRAAVPLLLHGRRCLHAACAPTESLRRLKQPASIHNPSAVNAAAVNDPATTSDPPRRRRRKLFTGTGTPRPDEERHSQQPSQQQQQQQQPSQQQQQQPVRQRRQAEVQEGWWQHPSAASELLLHVFWDLDNLHPDHWEQADELVRVLKSELEPFGRLQQLQAYANSRTLVSTVGVDGIEDLVEEQEEELRCEICGRRCKSFDDLQKHFKQLHEREHKKRLRAPKKAASKYAASDKAARVRDAGRLYGTPKKNRSGRRGQLVKVVLQRAGVKVIEVASQKQAADDAINRHMEALLQQLAAAEPVPAAAPAGHAAAAGRSQGQADTPWLWPQLQALPSAQDCLGEMVSMSQEEVRLAWKYLKKMRAAATFGEQWNMLWQQLQRARRDQDADGLRAACPDWLSAGWEDYHAQQREQREQQQQQLEQEGAEAAAAGVLPHVGDSASTALQQSVLVIISDDRGFASSVARWLRSGQAAGVLLISTRGVQAWEAPLLAAFKSCGLTTSPWQSVAIASWDVMVDQLRDRYLDMGGSDADDDYW